MSPDERGQKVLGGGTPHFGNAVEVFEETDGDLDYELQSA